MSDPILAPSCRVVLTWAPPEDPNQRGVRIFRRDTPVDSTLDGEELWFAVGDFTGDRAVIEGLVPTQRYHFAAAPILFDGTVPPADSWQVVTVVPEAHPEGPPLPAQVQDFAASQEEGMLHFRWTPNDDGVTVGYEIRRDDWDGGILVGKTTAPFLEAPWGVSGVSETYYIRAYDAQGRHGTIANLHADGSQEITPRPVGDMVPTNTYDESGGGFGGTKTDTEVSSSKLQPKAFGEISAATSGDIAAYATYAQGGLYKAPSTYQTSAKDLSVIHLARFEMDLAAAAVAAASLKIYDMTGLIGGSIEDADGVALPIERRPGEQRWTIFGEHKDSLDVLVEIDTGPTNTAVEGNVVWDGWRPFVPGEYWCRWVRWRITFGGDGFFYPQITTLKFYHRKRNRKDEGSVTVTADPGPTAVTFTTPFTVAPVVVAAVLDAAGTEFIVQASNITTSGCDLRAYDAAGAEVFTGTIHWHAMGT